VLTQSLAAFIWDKVGRKLQAGGTLKKKVGFQLTANRVEHGRSIDGHPPILTTWCVQPIPSCWVSNVSPFEHAQQHLNIQLVTRQYANWTLPGTSRYIQAKSSRLRPSTSSWSPHIRSLFQHSKTPIIEDMAVSLRWATDQICQIPSVSGCVPCLFLFSSMLNYVVV
jgi:hypothetical protein